MDAITGLSISLTEIDRVQEIDENRRWTPIFGGREADPTQHVFVGFYAGESPEAGEELEYTTLGIEQESFWVYKTPWTVQELKDGIITPQDLIADLQEEQPNIEIAGLCKYERDTSA